MNIPRATFLRLLSLITMELDKRRQLPLLYKIQPELCPKKRTRK